jgi:hypothetical protein
MACQTSHGETLMLFRNIPRWIATVVALVTLLSLTQQALGFVAVYLPSTLQASYVKPPVVFHDVGGGYTTALLGPNSTSTNVTVDIPANYIITLVSRAAIYWSNFTSDPFASGELIPPIYLKAWRGGVLNKIL